MYENIGRLENLLVASHNPKLFGGYYHTKSGFLPWITSENWISPQQNEYHLTETNMTTYKRILNHLSDLEFMCRYDVHFSYFMMSEGLTHGLGFKKHKISANQNHPATHLAKRKVETQHHLKFKQTIFFALIKFKLHWNSFT